MANWWVRNIVEPGKLPLLLCLVALVVTFLVARTITRMIRAGRGPFHDVSTGKLHVHHVVPGIILATAGGFAMASTNGHGVGKGVAAAVFGVGTGLVLDEFALVLHLHDVYWSEQGRTSVEAVLLTATVACVGLLGTLPFGVNNVDTTEHTDRTEAVVIIAVNLFFALIAFAKGKLRLGVIGIVIPLVAWVAALRLARPGSPWANRFYAETSRRARRAAKRAVRHDARWGRLRTKVENIIGGTPSKP